MSCSLMIPKFSVHHCSHDCYQVMIIVCAENSLFKTLRKICIVWMKVLTTRNLFQKLKEALILGHLGRKTLANWKNLSENFKILSKLKEFRSLYFEGQSNAWGVVEYHETIVKTYDHISNNWQFMKYNKNAAYFALT